MEEPHLLSVRMPSDCCTWHWLCLRHRTPTHDAVNNARRPLRQLACRNTLASQANAAQKSLAAA